MPLGGGAEKHCLGQCQTRAAAVPVRHPSPLRTVCTVWVSAKREQLPYQFGIPVLCGQVQRGVVGTDMVGRDSAAPYLGAVHCPGNGSRDYSVDSHEISIADISIVPPGPGRGGSTMPGLLLRGVLPYWFMLFGRPWLRCRRRLQ